MGRPVKRDVNGTLVFGTYVGAAEGIRVTAFLGGISRNDCYILRQRGSSRYRVYDVSDATEGVCKLVSGAPSANGEMRIMGLVGGNLSNTVAIKRLFKRTAVDFSSNRYKWELRDDSATGEEGYIDLTAI